MHLIPGPGQLFDVSGNHVENRRARLCLLRFCVLSAPWGCGGPRSPRERPTGSLWSTPWRRGGARFPLTPSLVTSIVRPAAAGP